MLESLVSLVSYGEHNEEAPRLPLAQALQAARYVLAEHFRLNHAGRLPVSAHPRAMGMYGSSVEHSVVAAAAYNTLADIHPEMLAREITSA